MSNRIIGTVAENGVSRSPDSTGKISHKLFAHNVNSLKLFVHSNLRFQKSGTFTAASSITVGPGRLLAGSCVGDST